MNAQRSTMNEQTPTKETEEQKRAREIYERLMKEHRFDFCNERGPSVSGAADPNRR